MPTILLQKCIPSLPRRPEAPLRGHHRPLTRCRESLNLKVARRGSAYFQATGGQSKLLHLITQRSSRTLIASSAQNLYMLPASEATTAQPELSLLPILHGMEGIRCQIPLWRLPTYLQRRIDLPDRRSPLLRERGRSQDSDVHHYLCTEASCFQAS
jgi:hypothetical protein